MTSPPEFTSTYGILDVTKGRTKLDAHLKKHGPIKVLIEATIREAYGHNDGVSIEFNLEVTAVSVTT